MLNGYSVLIEVPTSLVLRPRYLLLATAGDGICT